MKEQEIIEGNKLIAIFDGWVLNNEYPDKDRTYTKNGNIELDTTFKYHKDWNLLMELVEKIESIKVHEDSIYSVTICSNVCRIDTVDKEITWYRSKNKINAVYKAVVEFIKWYK